MNFGVIFELAVLVAYITILVGGRGTREVGWKILSPLLFVVAAAQLVAMTLVVSGVFVRRRYMLRLRDTETNGIFQAYLYDHDNRFFVGWALDKSWILCTVSWIVLFLNSVGITSAAFLLPPEDDYEMIPEPR